MGPAPSKPVKPPKPIKPKKKPLSAEEVISIMNRHPDVVKQYYKTNEEKIEKYIVENFWEEDVERWLIGIRNRSPKEHLQVRKLDYLKKVNTEAHHTSLYENESLVIRRASEFDIDVYFGNRNFDQERDDLSISFAIGDDPKEADNSFISCFVSNKPGEKTKWFCTMIAADNKAKKVTLRVNVPANAIVGRYKVSLDITSGVKGGRVNTTHDDASIIVIFNPFSEADTVYMGNEEFRNEYVLNDSGLINVGSYHNQKDEEVGKKYWDFAQFDEGVLDAVLLMLKKDTRMVYQPIKTLKKYNSPVFVSRALSAMINCNDDDGVLEGRWGRSKEEYADGKVPNYWKNSAEILLQWKNNDMSPVKYGQCWVFSGVLTTALRAIGIPARSITNFQSAHDTDMNETIDSYFSLETFEEIDSGDSVWNFHVWNEGYFKRPDLPEGYDGWQVLDATPQEESAILHPETPYNALMQCGPAPVKAVKEGDINVGYDTPFVFSEVNADKVTWYVNKKGKVTVGQKDTRAVGVYIGTKAVGKFKTENVIDQYKYREGTNEERNAFKKAYGFGTMKHHGGRPLFESNFKIAIEKPKTRIVGQELNYKIKVSNNSEKKDAVSVKISAGTKTHIGQIHAMLKKTKHDVEINAGETKVIDFKLSHDDYINNLVDDFTVNTVVIVTSSEDNNICMKQLDISLEYPECISVKLPESVPFGKESQFDFELKNIFPIKLTKGDFDITGRGLSSDSVQMTVDEPILPGESFKVEGVKVNPKYGWKYVRAAITFDSAEFKGIQHNFRIKVT